MLAKVLTLALRFLLQPLASNRRFSCTTAVDCCCRCLLLRLCLSANLKPLRPLLSTLYCNVRTREHLLHRDPLTFAPHDYLVWLCTCFLAPLLLSAACYVFLHEVLIPATAPYDIAHA